MAFIGRTAAESFAPQLGRETSHTEGVVERDSHPRPGAEHAEHTPVEHEVGHDVHLTPHEKAKITKEEETLTHSLSEDSKELASLKSKYGVDKSKWPPAVQKLGNQISEKMSAAATKVNDLVHAHPWAASGAAAAAFGLSGLAIGEHMHNNSETAPPQNDSLFSQGDAGGQDQGQAFNPSAYFSPTEYSAYAGE